MGPFERGCPYLQYRHHSLVSGQTTGRESSPAHQQKTGLKIYQAWPRPSEQDLVSPSVSLSHQRDSMKLSMKIIGTSFKRYHAGLSQCPQPCSRPPPTHTSARDFGTLISKSGSVSCGFTSLFSWVLVHIRFCLYPLRACFPSPVQVL